MYGIHADDERRLKQWVDLAQAKCPGAPLVIIGTHRDMLRDQSPMSVRKILNKVCAMFREYIATLTVKDRSPVIGVLSSFCVSCKDRSVVPENPGGPEKMKEMFQWLSEICFMRARTDPVFAQGAVPRVRVHLRDIQKQCID